MSKETKRSKIKDALKETFDASSIHSFPNLVRNKYKSIKIIWIICLLISLSFCAYLIVQQVFKYLDYEVVSTIKELYESPISFPVISICNLNFFATQMANTNPLLLDIFNVSNSFYTDDMSERLNFYNARFTAISYSNYINTSLRDQLGYKLNETIISCIFNNVDCSLENDFIEYFDPLYGNCFQFNSEKTKQLLLTGSMNGLQLELFTKGASINENVFSMYSGFYVFISNQNKFNSYDFDGVSVPLGYSTNIILSKISFKKQPKPYSNCDDNLVTVDAYHSDVYKMTFLFNGFYTRDYCMNMCYQIRLGLKCGCYDATSGPFPSDLRPCLNSTDQQCDTDTWNDFLFGDSHQSCDCPFECIKTDYTFSSCISEYPTKSYAKYLINNPPIKQGFDNNSNITYDILRSSVCAVNVFYNELIETSFNEDVKIESVDLISTIGGILALFIGISFLSFIEFLEIFLQTIYIIYDDFKLKKKNNVINIIPKEEA